MPKTLIVHHVTPEYEYGDNSRYFDSEEYIPAILEYVDRIQPDKIIVTRKRSDALFPALENRASHIEVWEWEVVFNETDEELALKHDVSVEELSFFEYQGDSFCSVLYPWMQALSGDEVFVIGGLTTECLAAFCQALGDLHVTFTREATLDYPRRV